MTILTQRKLLITGASRGIGRAITEATLAMGAQVIGIGREFDHWSEMPAGLMPIILDLAQLDALATQLESIKRQHPDLNGLILSAGAGRFGSLEEFSATQIRMLIDLNLTQHLLVIRTFLPQLKQNGFGDLILIGSESGLSGGAKGAVYAAAKFGLRGAAQALRQECARSGVRVTLINPGMVKTDFFNQLDFAPGDDPSQHLRAQDVAQAVTLVLNAHPGTVFDEINLSPLKKVIQFHRNQKANC